MLTNLMPIVFVHRNGPPAPQLCPMVLCEVCGERIYQNRASSLDAPEHALQPGIATIWARYIEPSTQPSHTRLESSPLFYVHKGECDRTYGRYIAQFHRPDDGWVNTWNDIREVIKQLTHTVTEPLENDPELATGNVVYYPPARIVDLRPNEFATTPLWLVGNPDRSS